MDPLRRHAVMADNGRPKLSHLVCDERMVALAEYRNACRLWVKDNCRDFDYTVVFDVDAWGGWSVDGLMTSVHWLANDYRFYGLASYSWAEIETPQGPFPIHYDALAYRWNHWRRRDQQFFHHWLPAVGSPPIPCNSAFGQLAIYRTRHFLDGEYSGEDCEHCCLHRSINAEHTLTSMGLNPSSRCVSFWVPNGRNHGDD
jgi:hypothetical protein